MTTIRILIFDDNLASVTQPLEKALQPFLTAGQRIPEFKGKDTPSISLKAVAETVECVFSFSTSTDASVVAAQIFDGKFKNEVDLVLLDSDWQNDRHAGSEKLLPAILNEDSGITGPGGMTPFIALFTGYWKDTWDQFWKRLEQVTHNKVGAEFRFDGLPKEDYGRLRLLFYSAVQTRRYVESERQRKLATRSLQPKPIVGNSAAIKALKKQIEKVAPTENTVLIRGDTGTGKELVARAIHFQSNRSGGSFVPVNCSALPENLLESELFGHRKGAFTGAISDKKGLFQEADGGTIFLDEIGSMSQVLQSRLLRVLQDREVRRVGDNSPIYVNVRVVAATNEPLEERMKKGAFREDLYYRLNVIPILLPPLRERPEDIPLLVTHFISNRVHPTTGEPFQLESNAMQVLRSYSWPGNVRELENAVHRMLAFAESEEVDLANIPDEISKTVARTAPPSLGTSNPGPNARSSSADDPNVAARNAKALALLKLWNDKVGEIWSAKRPDIADPVKRENFKVTTDELGQCLKKTGAAAKAAKTTGKGLQKTGAAVRQDYGRYRHEMIAVVKADSSAFSNLKRLDVWNQWFGVWLAQ